MAIEWIDKETGCSVFEANNVYECLYMIWAIGCDYDGRNTVESLKDLVDDLVGCSNKARSFLLDGRLFPARNELHILDMPDDQNLLELSKKISDNIHNAMEVRDVRS